MRTYLRGTTECGEDVTFEAWGETRRSVMTYAFDPGRTELLPEITESGIPEMPMSCLDDPVSASD